MATTIYSNTNNMRILNICMKTALTNGQLFSIDIYIYDKVLNHLVCRVIVDPSLRDHRTGKWITYSALHLYAGIAFTTPLRDVVRKAASNSVKDLIEMYFGEEE